MKLLCSCVLILSTFSTTALGLEFHLGLNSQDPAVRSKQVVLVYFSNDRMAPLPSAKMNQVTLYLDHIGQGKNYYPYQKSEVLLTSEETSTYQQLSDADRKYLASIGGFSSTDSSERATSGEFRALLDHVTRRNPKYRMGFVVFRNFHQRWPFERSTVDKFTYYHCPPGHDKEAHFSGEVDVSKISEDLFRFPYSDQPVCHPELFARLMDEVYKLYPPDQHRYVVVIKSQGGKEMVATPRYESFAPEIAPQKLWEGLLKHKAEILQGESAVLPRTRGTNARLSQVLREVQGQKRRYGLTIADVLETLRRSKGEFPIVFFDVNEVEISSELRMPDRFPNIGDVFFTGKSVPYELIDYDDVFSFLGVQATDFEERFREVLKAELPT